MRRISFPAKVLFIIFLLDLFLGYFSKAAAESCAELKVDLGLWTGQETPMSKRSLDIPINGDFPQDFQASEEVLQRFQVAIVNNYFHSEQARQSDFEFVTKNYRVFSDFDQLNDIELFAVNAYTGGVFFVVNKALRKSPQIPLTQDVWDIIQVIVSGLQKCNKFQGKVYRSADLSPERIAEITAAQKTGVIITERTFLSTSKTNLSFDKKSFFNGRNTSFEITSKTGVDLSKSLNESEMEVLFSINRKFKVLEVSQRADNIMVIKLEEIDEN